MSSSNIVEEKGSLLVEFLVSLALFSLVTYGLSEQLLMHSKVFKSAETTRSEISTNQDIIDAYLWFRKSVDHQQAVIKTSLLFEDDFSINCNNKLTRHCYLHRNDKSIGFYN